MRGCVAVVHSILCCAVLLWPRSGEGPLTTGLPVRSAKKLSVCVGRLRMASLGLHADAAIFSNRLTTIAMSEVGPW